MLVVHVQKKIHTKIKKFLYIFILSNRIVSERDCFARGGVSPLVCVCRESRVLYPVEKAYT